MDVGVVHGQGRVGWTPEGGGGQLAREEGMERRELGSRTRRREDKSDTGDVTRARGAVGGAMMSAIH